MNQQDVQQLKLMTNSLPRNLNGVFCTGAVDLDQMLRNFLNKEVLVKELPTQRSQRLLPKVVTLEDSQAPSVHASSTAIELGPDNSFGLPQLTGNLKPQSALTSVDSFARLSAAPTSPATVPAVSIERVIAPIPLVSQVALYDLYDQRHSVPVLQPIFNAHSLAPIALSTASFSVAQQTDVFNRVARVQPKSMSARYVTDDGEASLELQPSFATSPQLLSNIKHHGIPERPLGGIHYATPLPLEATFDRVRQLFGPTRQASKPVTLQVVDIENPKVPPASHLLLSDSQVSLGTIGVAASVSLQSTEKINYLQHEQQGVSRTGSPSSRSFAGCTWNCYLRLTCFRPFCPTFIELANVSVQFHRAQRH